VHPQGDDAADLTAAEPAAGAGADDADGADGADVELVVHRPPAWAPLTLVAFVALVVCTNVANVVWANWADEHPAGLLGLSSRQRYLVLSVTGGIGPISYAIIGTLRLAVAFFVCHMVGRAYRDQALSWFTRYLGVRTSQLDTLRDGFSKAEIGLIPFFAGSNIVAVLTGVHRTRPGKLALLLGIGIAGRLILFWYLSKAFEDQLLDIMSFISRYQWWLLGLSIAIVVLANLRNFRRGAGS
jgi:hypothetical protein